MNVFYILASQHDSKEWGEYITLGIALLGAGLGIYNVVINHLDKKTKILIEPHWALNLEPNFKRWLSVNLVNKSNYEVTVSNLSLMTNRSSDGHIPFGLHAAGEVQLPVRIKPRDSVRILFNQDFHSIEEFSSMRKIEITTADRQTFKKSVKKLMKRHEEFLEFEAKEEETD